MANQDPNPSGRELKFITGNSPGLSFRVKGLDSEVKDRSVGGPHRIVEGVIPDGWRRVAVITGKDSSYRYFELVPTESGYEELQHFDTFYVAGPFRIATKVNNSRAAREAFKLFEAE